MSEISELISDRGICASRRQSPCMDMSETIKTLRLNNDNKHTASRSSARCTLGV